MIPVTADLAIEEKDIRLDFVRSSGPGGQNVNKVSTAVQLRFDVAAAAYIPEEVRERLITLAGSRMTDKGVLVIDARRFRSQAMNREDAFERLKALVRQAARKPKGRRRTSPSPAARRRRLEDKRRRSALKRQRQQDPRLQD